jgi:hypothetical protein
MEQFRKITKEEFEKILESHHDSDLIRNAREYVKKYYSSKAYKVWIHTNCDYNDNYYDINPVILVIDKDLNELDPIVKGADLDSIFEKYYATGRGSEEVYDNIEDFSFIMIDNNTIPELYIKTN